jgi:hypothetical protein
VQQNILQEAETSRAALDKKLASVSHEADAAQQDAGQQKELKEENEALQRQLHSLQAELEKLREKPQIAKKPDKRMEATNQDCHESDRVIEQLQQTLRQKDRVRGFSWLSVVVQLVLTRFLCVSWLGDRRASANGSSRMHGANVTARENAQRKGDA